MADIFVSYTSSDRDWAFWIGQELEKLGHVAHVHEWELPVGGDIPAWMEERVQKADQVLCVVSAAYLTKDYSSWERRSAQWAAQRKRQNFVVPVFVEDCEAPVTFAHIKRCDLFGLSEDDARALLKSDFAPVAKPLGPARFPGAKSGPLPFPGEAQPEKSQAARQQAIAQESKPFALSNIPINVPRHFLGRDDALAAIDTALKRDEGRAAITALHGMRGVGKTTLAAAYADRHRNDYRATWWIRAQTESTMRADLVSLAVRLDWVTADEKEEPALAAVRRRLRDEGDGILLIYDNAVDARNVEPYLPTGGLARVLVTSNAPDWSGIAEPVEIEVWPKEIGADYLVARTRRAGERAEAEALSLALGGLPLAHEQAAAYCGRIGISLGDYRKRFEAAPARLLDIEIDAPVKYRLTAVKAFALAIDEATKVHPAAEALIVHAALLAPEPIPLFLFSEAREKFGEPLASQLGDEGLVEAVAALRAFALVDRETIPDERDSTIMTETIRLHRLVRAVAANRLEGEAIESVQQALIQAMAAVFPNDVYDDPSVWPRARRLDALALDLVLGSPARVGAVPSEVSYLLSVLGRYRRRALAAYPEARPLLERALAISEKIHGAEHPETASKLSDLGDLLRQLRELSQARPLLERALAIREKILGPEHPDTATSLITLAALLRDQDDHVGARPLYHRALAIREKSLGPKHPLTAYSLNDVALILHAQGDLDSAQKYYDRALSICEKEYGPRHPNTSVTRTNLARLMLAQGAVLEALGLARAALSAHDEILGAGHTWTKDSADATGAALDALGRGDEAAALRTRYGL